MKWVCSKHRMRLAQPPLAFFLISAMVLSISTICVEVTLTDSSKRWLTVTGRAPERLYSLTTRASALGGIEVDEYVPHKTAIVSFMAFCGWLSKQLLVRRCNNIPQCLLPGGGAFSWGN